MPFAHLGGRLADRIALKLDPVFTRQFNEDRHFWLAFFGFFSAGREEMIKTAWYAQHNDRESVIPSYFRGVGNSLGKIDHVTRSALKQLAAQVYLYFSTNR